MRHLEGSGRAGRIVVWAHNSHIGDARATERAHIDELNLGQLLREHGLGALLVGFTTHAGEVAAASEWGGVVARKAVRPSLPDSVERLLHDTGAGHLFCPCAPGPRASRCNSSASSAPSAWCTCPRRSGPVHSDQMTAQVRDGRVILHGLVATKEEKWMAERDVWYIEGVHDVVNELDIYRGPTGREPLPARPPGME